MQREDQQEPAGCVVNFFLAKVKSAYEVMSMAEELFTLEGARVRVGSLLESRGVRGTWQSLRVLHIAMSIGIEFRVLW